MRSIAIDPGTYSTAITCFNGRSICGYVEIDSYELSKKPHYLIEIIDSMDPDIIVAPSGYGLPPTDLREFEPGELIKRLFKPKDDPGIEELKFIRYFYKRIKYFKVPVIGLPGVRDLDSVPIYRKIYRLDLGTADKVGTVIYALSKIYDRDPKSIYRSRIIVVELGAFTSAIAVSKGIIVDGIGGTVFGIGLKSLGNLDLELAIYFKKLYKKHIFSGGIYDLCRSTDLNQIRSSCTAIYSRYIDDIVKSIYMLIPSIEFKIDAIYLSGRASRYSNIKEDIIRKLKHYKNIIKHLKSPKPKIKQSSIGMAIYGCGYLGGPYKELIDHLILKQYNSRMRYKFILSKN